MNWREAWLPMFFAPLAGALMGGVVGGILLYILHLATEAG